MFEPFELIDLNTRFEEELAGQDGYKIERVLGSIKGWLGGLQARYVGLLKMHGQHVLAGIAYNLYRLCGLIVSHAKVYREI